MSEQQKIYDITAASLGMLVEGRRQHHASEPDCGGSAMCIGALGTMGLAAAIREDPASLMDMLIVAIGEMQRLSDEQLRTAGALASARAGVALAIERAETAETTASARGDRLIDLELRCADLQDKVDTWERLSDTLGPVHRPD